MKIEQKKWTEAKGWEPEPPCELGASAQLVLLFGSTLILKAQKCFREIKNAYPKALLFGCSTAGEICGTHVNDDSLIATAINFKFTQLKGS